MFVVGALARGELNRYDTKSATFAPFLSGISADGVSFSKDGQWVAYVNYPDTTLWKSKSDGSQRMQLTSPPLNPELPTWSPDGKQIAFYGILPGKKAKLYAVVADGGTPRELIPEDPLEAWDATWSADGTRIAFAGAPADPNSAGWSLSHCDAVRIPQPDAPRFRLSKVGGDREDQHGLPQLVEKRRLCLLPP